MFDNPQNLWMLFYILGVYDVTQNWFEISLSITIFNRPPLTTFKPLTNQDIRYINYQTQVAS